MLLSEIKPLNKLIHLVDYKHSGPLLSVLGLELGDAVVGAPVSSKSVPSSIHFLNWSIVACGSFPEVGIVPACISAKELAASALASSKLLKSGKVIPVLWQLRQLSVKSLSIVPI